MDFNKLLTKDLEVAKCGSILEEAKKCYEASGGRAAMAEAMAHGFNPKEYLNHFVNTEHYAIDETKLKDNTFNSIGSLIEKLDLEVENSEQRIQKTKLLYENIVSKKPNEKSFRLIGRMNADPLKKMSTEQIDERLREIRDTLDQFCTDWEGPESNPQLRESLKTLKKFIKRGLELNPKNLRNEKTIHRMEVDKSSQLPEYLQEFLKNSEISENIIKMATEKGYSEADLEQYLNENLIPQLEKLEKLNRKK